MLTMNLVRNLALLVPVAFLLVSGLILTLGSGFESGRTSSRLLLGGKNLSHAVVLVGACLMGLFVIQQAIGFRPESPW